MSWFERAKLKIPGGVNSPVRSFKHVGGSPVYFDRAEGARLYDVDGKKYIDFCLSFGPHILGHNPPEVVAAIQQQVLKASSFGACHPLEVLLAEEILRAVPFLDQVRLMNSGTEAVMTAVRLARGATRRNKVVVFEGCYHGHSDALMAKAGSGVAELADASSAGVPAGTLADTLIVRWDDWSTVEYVFAQWGKEIAAVLLEAIPANCGLQETPREKLESLCSLARNAGALVIFDEVITGFRIGYSGASGWYDLKPDLITYGKVLGGGLPLAAVVGRKDTLCHLAPEGAVYQAGTFAGNPLCIAAGLAALKVLQRDQPYLELATATSRFVEQLTPLLQRRGPVQIRHIGSLFWFLFDEAIEGFPPKISDGAKAAYVSFFQDALTAGVYFPPSPYEVSFLSTAHTPSVLSEAIERLQG